MEPKAGRIQKTRVGDIPVVWVEPEASRDVRQLVVFLPHLGGTKETVIDALYDLAADGLIAVSFDPWQHGERTRESREELLRRVFSAFRQEMWPILGQTTLDTLRILDWATSALRVTPDFRIGGLSMGGDVAVAAAGLDRRVTRVVSVVATPDWLRPGMHDLTHADQLIEQGRTDAYAQFFYDAIDPLTHPTRYHRAMEISFLCGERDNHVPADGALRFQQALTGSGNGIPRTEVEWIAGLAHLDVRDRSRWWPQCRQRLVAPLVTECAELRPRARCELQSVPPV